MWIICCEAKQWKKSYVSKVQIHTHVIDLKQIMASGRGF